MREGAPKGLNTAVMTAARALEADGVTRLLTIPGDVPLITAEEVDAAFATDAGRFPVVLIPSASGAGTNGLLTSPPTILAPRFEGQSLAAHRTAATAAGLGSTTLALPSFALDVDTPEDLAALATSATARRSVIMASRSKNAA
jgi:2-phospho-L-lactate guanylyltransferase